MFETFTVLGGIEPLFVQLEIWAREDARSGTPVFNSDLLAIAVLKEFVSDVRTAFGSGQEDAIDEDRLDWPDLAVTYRKAVDVLSRSAPGGFSGQEPI